MWQFWILTLLWAGLILPSFANEPIRPYRTREEQREAGRQKQLTPWLSASGLAEFDWAQDHLSRRNGADDRETIERLASLQLGFLASPWDTTKTELIVEYDSEFHALEVDEFFISVEADAWELELGRQYLPFGEYASYFVSGPFTEFGEIRESAITLSYHFEDTVDFSLSLYRGVARQRDQKRRIDGVFAFQAQPSSSVTIGMSYLSDLADTDSRLLADANNRYAHKIAGISGYMLYVGDGFEIAFEALAATRSFAELESNFDRPRAWNLEVAFFLHPRFDLAFRIEGSEELQDTPQLQTGFLMMVTTRSLISGILAHSYRSYSEVMPIGQRFSMFRMMTT